MEGRHDRAETRIEGIPVSPGIVRGAVMVTGRIFEAPEAQAIEEGAIAQEIERFEAALAATRKQIKAMQGKIADSVGSEDASIFDAHLLVLEDRTVLDEVVRSLRERRVNIEAVFYAVLSRYIESLRQIDDPYLRERVIDVEDVARRVIRNLQGVEVESEERSIPDGAGPVILVAHELTPSETAAVDQEIVGGFATELGGQTSHAAIMARSLNIPAVVGLHDVCRRLESGEEVLLDGYHGVVILNPSGKTLAYYEELESQKKALAEKLAQSREKQAITSDGDHIILSGNIEFIHELDQVHASGAEGVGLYRTEFFYMNRAEFPPEEEQAENYRRVSESVQPNAAIIRTLDIGGDKLYPELHAEEEQNPFLGWRGIRVSLEERQLFKTQLRAILRASHHGKTGIMYPLVSGVEEVKAANRILEECRGELREEGVPFDESLEVGAMMEVPSAAMMAELIAPEVDFFSIGTNDLVQYTIAVDRVNEKVASLYQPTHPGVIRLIKRIVDAAHEHSIWVGICGEMAGDIVLTPLLVGMGLDEFSVGSGQLPQVKYAIRRLERKECVGLVEELLGWADPAEIRDRCETVAREKYPELFE
ncbi:MAG: phosphoenolpyruvate--protein phosphotransferase [Verrucomicrobiota bacterium]